MEGKYLITTDNWFFAPDGKQYSAVWGDVTIVDDSVLGIKTNARSSNWYAKVGPDGKHVIVAGCQIHYAVQCLEKPEQGAVKDSKFHDGKFIDAKRPTYIYIAE